MSGFAILQKTLLQRKDISAMTKLAFAAIVDAIRENEFAWPGVRTIARWIGCSLTAAQRAIDQIEETNLLAVEHRGPGKSNRYRRPDQNGAHSDDRSVLETSTEAHSKRVRSPKTQAHSKRVQGVLETSTEAPSRRVHKKTRRSKKTKGMDAWCVALENMTTSTLKTEAFKTAWAEWCHCRQESKKPLTRTTIGRQIQKLESWGVDRAIAAIEHTIFKGWQGLREPESSRGNRSGRVEARPGKYDNLETYLEQNQNEHQQISATIVRERTSA